MDRAAQYRWRSIKLAYSGGIDSQALLQILADFRGEWRLDLQAIHIHHGMHPQADEWERFCREQCERLDVNFLSYRVSVDVSSGGPEAAARAARYEQLAKFIRKGDVLLTAHHEDDQAETFLLQLMRGAGAAGLASMPIVSGFSAGHHFRPLLKFSRRQIQDFASDRRLSWVEDPSNTDIGVRRSFVRQQLVPLLRQEWPHASSMIARSAAHIAEADTLLAELAELDHAQCTSEWAQALSVSRLALLPAHRTRNLLRFWIRRQGWTSPSARQLEQITRQVYESSVTAQATVRWGQVVCYRYRDRLWLQPWVTPRALSAQSYDWSPESGPLELPDAGIKLAARPVVGQGLATSRAVGKVTVGFRSGGETCRLHRQGHRTTLKNLFQQADIPPWERDRMPLVYVEGELAAVGDRWVCEPFTARQNEAGWQLKISEIQRK